MAIFMDMHERKPPSQTNMENTVDLPAHGCCNDVYDSTEKKTKEGRQLCRSAFPLCFFMLGSRQPRRLSRKTSSKSRIHTIVFFPQSIPVIAV